MVARVAMEANVTLMQVKRRGRVAARLWGGVALVHVARSLRHQRRKARVRARLCWALETLAPRPSSAPHRHTSTLATPS